MGKFTIGQTLDRGIRLYKQTIGKVLLLISAPCVLSLTNTRAILNPDPAHPFSAFNGMYFIALIAGGWAWVVATRYVHKKSLGEDPAFGDIIKFARPADFLLVFSAIIWYAALFLGTIVLIVPGIYLLNICMIGMIIIIVERKYFFNSIGRTYKLTKGRWWKTFVINLVSCLIVGVPVLIGMALFMGPTLRQSLKSPQAVAAGNLAPEISMMTILGFIAYMVIIALIYPLLITINVVHYNSLMSEKEHTDLNSQLDTLQASSFDGV
jgi:hypothetical protein